MVGAAHDVEAGRHVDARQDRLPLMRQVAAAMWVAGGLMCGVGSLITQTGSDGRLAYALFAGVFVLGGLVLAALPARYPVLVTSTFVSLVLLGVLVAASQPLGSAPLFYLWPVVYAAYFLSRRVLGWSMAAAAASLGVALAVNADHTLALDTFVGTIASVGLVAALVAHMRRREEALQARLSQEAVRDPLTGLLNRRGFDPGLDRLVERAMETGEDLAVVTFDLDRFKRYNDTHGHPAGDEALRRMAVMLDREARMDDLVARVGGEEFAVALPLAHVGAARAYASRVAVAMARERVAPAFRLSTSAGIDCLGPAASTREALLQRADEALYAAKEAGRGRCAWWEDDALVVGEAFASPDHHDGEAVPGEELPERRMSA